MVRLAHHERVGAHARAALPLPVDVVRQACPEPSRRDGGDTPHLPLSYLERGHICAEWAKIGILCKADALRQGAGTLAHHRT